MVAHSDIEEIEIEDSNSLDNEDSNLSEPRQLRRRKSRKDDSAADSESSSKFDDKPKVGRPGKYNKRSQRIIDKEREEFLNEFDQNKSERERRKKNYKVTGQGSLFSVVFGSFSNI